MNSHIGAVAIAAVSIVAATTSAATPIASARTLPFTSSVATVSASTLGATWHAGCPVGPAGLHAITLAFIGFDHERHVGTIVVATSVVPAVIKVFSTLYRERFPIRSIIPESSFGGKDPLSMAADNTSGFNCRYAVAPGPPKWSVHALGEAIDVNPFENPYLEGGKVQPAGAGRYLVRSEVRPGMAVPGGDLNEAFSSIGWFWGGRWTASPDYQHFSATGG